MFYAHWDKDTKKGQTLEDHLTQTAEKTAAGLEPLSFSMLEKKAGRKDFEKFLYQMGYYHDAGKAMYSFQKYLKTNHGGREKNHALISAAIFSDITQEVFVLPYLGAIAIAKHHGELTLDIETHEENFSQLEKQYEDWIQQSKKDGFPAFSIKAQKLSKSEFKEFLEEHKDEVEDVYSEYYSIENFFLLQYLFSKLIWADKLDSAGLHRDTISLPASINDVANHIASKGAAKVNEKREAIRQTVLTRIEALSDEDFQKQRIFLLTAPTGTGKTLTSICAALAVAKRMKGLYGKQPNLIAALPFINILEQTKMEYEAIFGSEAVLTHYSGTDLTKLSEANEKSEKAKGTKGEESTPLQDKMLLLSAWEKPVVLTTFVQFFESVLSDKNRRLIKVHKLAGSIVILDEVQALPVQYYALAGAVLYHLSKFYGTRFILMTATQPAIAECAQKLIEAEGETWTYELLPDHAKYYAALTRTRIVPVMDQVQNNTQLVDFIQATKPVKSSALVVVNTIAQSIEVYKGLKAYAAKNDCSLLYLSTNLISVDRKRVIKTAKKLLAEKKPLLLVATQTVEAGVDLDFDFGYRDAAPLEAIIQIAGRINRAGDKGTHCPLYVFQTVSSRYVYQAYFRQETEMILRMFGEVGEERYLEMMKAYYQKIVDHAAFDKIFYKAMQALDYATIAEFSLIEEQNDVKTVFIERTENIIETAKAYADLLKKQHLEFEEKAQLKVYLNQLSQYTVDVRVSKLIKNLPCRFKDVYGVNLDWYVVQAEDVPNYYNETGFVSDNKAAFIY